MIEYVIDIRNNLKNNRTLQSLILCVSKYNMGKCKDMIVKGIHMQKSQDKLVIAGKLFFDTLVNEEKVTSSSKSRRVDIKILYDEFGCSPKIIELPNKHINDDAACLITFGLYNNTTVEKLDLSHNEITVIGMNILL